MTRQLDDELMLLYDAGQQAGRLHSSWELHEGKVISCFLPAAS